MIYLHIPFCDSKCNYCAFNSFVTLHHLKEAYFTKLEEQLKNDLDHFNIRRSSIKSVFIGGGTPSCVQANFYEPLFNVIKPYLTLDAEISTEANPKSASLEWLQAMKTLGVNRVSFGVQSFNTTKLKTLGRNHDNKHTFQSLDNAIKAGFENISLDLIYATSYDNLDFMKKELKHIQNLPINHLSAYMLMIEEGTPFYKKPYLAVDHEGSYEYLCNFLSNLGLKQYEISNFGSYECRHNKGYWNYEDYLGIGAGAVGSITQKSNNTQNVKVIKKLRYYPNKDLKHYIENPLFKKFEYMDKEAIKVEKIMLGLRSKIGFKRSILNNEEQNQLDILIANKPLEDISGHIYNYDYSLADAFSLYILGN